MDEGRSGVASMTGAMAREVLSDYEHTSPTFANGRRSPWEPRGRPRCSSAAAVSAKFSTVLQNLAIDATQPVLSTTVTLTGIAFDAGVPFNVMVALGRPFPNLEVSDGDTRRRRRKPWSKRRLKLTQQLPPFPG